MGLVLRRVSWAQRPDPTVFATRLGERLGVAVMINIRTVDPPQPGNLPGEGPFDMVIDITSPKALSDSLDSLEWGPCGGRVLNMMNGASDDLAGAVVLTLMELGAKFSETPQPMWQGTLAEIRARHSLVSKLQQLFGRKPD